MDHITLLGLVKSQILKDIVHHEILLNNLTSYDICKPKYWKTFGLSTSHASTLFIISNRVS